MKTRRFAWWKSAWLTFSIGLTASAAIAQSLEVIALEHRTAQELIPAIQPLLSSGGALSGQDYTLFVRTTSSNLAEIKRVIAQLDRAPRQLRVSVRTGSHAEMQREGVSVEGELSTRGANAGVRGVDSNAESARSTVASVSVLEGSAALISSGSTVPIVTAIAVGSGRRPWIAARTEFRDLPNGFLVTPRVNGNTVILDVQQRSDSARGGQIETQQVQTQVTGTLGTWISLGGISSSATTSQRGLNGRSYSTHSDDRSVWVKVDAP